MKDRAFTHEDMITIVTIILAAMSVQLDGERLKRDLAQAASATNDPLHAKAVRAVAEAIP
jgi:hypothetical protein